MTVTTAGGALRGRGAKVQKGQARPAEDSLEMVAVAIIDDHIVVHDGVRAAVEADPALDFVGGARTSAEGLALVDSQKPDVLLIDIRLGKESGFTLCKELRRRFPELGILIFSGFCNSELLTEAIRAGAGGYLLKETDTNRLASILREFHQHGSYFHPGAVADFLTGIATGGRNLEGRPEASHLSAQDLRIIELIADGHTNYDIATELNLSSNTVKFHVSRLLRRFGVARRTELVKLAMERQILIF